MKKRTHLLILVFVSLQLTAQPTERMNAAVDAFIKTRQLMVRSTGWSHAMNQYNFKYVVNGDGEQAVPQDFQQLLQAFTDNVQYASGCYFHDRQDGEPPFYEVRLARKDNYFSGIYGGYRMDSTDNFRILNFNEPSAGLTSFGMVWHSQVLHDRHGQSFTTLDGYLFRFFGGEWTMQPFQPQPVLHYAQTANEPIRGNDAQAYETLLEQVRYLANAYREATQGKGSQQGEAVAYMLKKVCEAYQGRLTEQQYSAIEQLIVPFIPQEQGITGNDPAVMMCKSLMHLQRHTDRVPSGKIHSQAVMPNAQNPFANPDAGKLLMQHYNLSQRQPKVNVHWTGITARDGQQLVVQPLCPNDYAATLLADSCRFTFNRQMLANTPVSIRDIQGRTLVLFADSVPTQIDLVSMTVKGSPLNERFADCQRRLRLLEPELQRYASRDADGDYTVMDVEGYNALLRDAHQLQLQMMDENQDNLIPVWYLTQNYASMTHEELSRYLLHSRPYADHVALQPVWQYYEGQTLRQTGSLFTDAACIDTQGQSHRLSDYIGQGQYVLLHFWMSWGSTARSQCKLMKQLQKQYPDLRVIGFALDPTKDDWSRYVEKRGLEFTHLSDPAVPNLPEPWESTVARLYGIQSLPETIIFDPHGRIVASALNTPDAIRQAVELLMK